MQSSGKKQKMSDGSMMVVEDLQQAQQPQEAVQKPKGAQTGYMFFVNEKKKEGSFTLTELGALWRDLPVDYKQKFQALAEEDKERYNREMAEYEKKCPEEERHFQLSRVKHILSYDEDTRVISKDGYAAILKAVELFGAQLAAHVKQKVRKDAKKEVDEDDLFTMINETQELEFLVPITAYPMRKKQKQSQGPKPAANEPLKNEARPMDAFLKK